MKILIISFTFPPNKDGVSEAASAMTKGFLDHGWEVEVFTHTVCPERQESSWNGAEITEFEYSGINDSRAIEIKDTSEPYNDYLVRGNWDVLVFHTYDTTTLDALPAFQRIPAKKILVSHGYGALIWELGPKFPYGLRGWVKRSCRSLKMFSWLKDFDRAVYLSDTADLRGFYDHWIARKSGYSGRRIIPNGVDLEERGKSPSEFRMINEIADDAFVFLCVANYSPRKDQGYAARAFRKATIPGSVLVFIGSDFNEHSRMFQAEDERSQATGTAPGEIIWLEKQSRPSTLNALAACDAYVLSANHEAQPIAILEAMRESKPWIARKAGCIATMEGGICVKSEAEMADAMQRLSDDRGLRERLGGEGRQAVATRYNRTTYIESYCNLIEELVSP